MHAIEAQVDVVAAIFSAKAISILAASHVVIRVELRTVCIQLDHIAGTQSWFFDPSGERH